MRSEEIYRVKPKLALTSGDIYKRLMANALEIQNPTADQYAIEEKLADARRLTKPQLLASIDQDRKNADLIKSKINKSLSNAKQP